MASTVQKTSFLELLNFSGIPAKDKVVPGSKSIPPRPIHPKPKIQHLQPPRLLHLRPLRPQLLLHLRLQHRRRPMPPIRPPLCFRLRLSRAALCMIPPSFLTFGDIAASLQPHCNFFQAPGFFQNLFIFYPRSIQHILSKIYRTSIPNQPNIYPTSIQHLSPIWTKTIQNLSDIEPTSIQNLFSGY